MIATIGAVPSPPARVTERQATLQARQLIGQDHLSWSQVHMFRSCPRKYAFAYVERGRPDFLPASLHFGGAMHASLEDHFRGWLEGRRVSPDKLFDAFMTAWGQRKEGQENLPIRYAQKEDAGKLFDLAKRMIGSFLASPVAQPAGQVIAVEESLRVVLLPDLPDIVARVVLIHQPDDGHLHLIDFKTSRGHWSQEKAEESAEQLLLYRHLAARLVPDQPMKLEFVVLTKHKTPVVESFEVQATNERLAQIKDTFQSVWAGIIAGNFHPSPSPANCVTCPYRSRCPAFVHSRDTGVGNTGGGDIPF